ncbi:hypothetical protein AZE42_06552, partial [Rhizopogon vesiculosus]
MTPPEPVQQGVVGQPLPAAQHVFELTPTTPLDPPGAPGSRNKKLGEASKGTEPPDLP